MLNIGQFGPGAHLSEHLLQKLGWQMVNLPREVANSFENHVFLKCANDPSKIPLIVSVLLHLKDHPYRSKCLSEIPKGSGPIICFGSGSSADPVMQHLKEWPGAIMTSTSQASTAAYYGRNPDYIVCMDPRVAHPDREFDAPGFGSAAFLAHPSVPMEYVLRWFVRFSGTLYLSRIMEPTYDWYSHHLGQGYPWVRHVMLPMIDSVAAEIGFATWLGYNPIFLAGVDYGGPRFQRFDYNLQTKEWVPDSETSAYYASRMDDVHYGMDGNVAMSYSSRGALISCFMQMANPAYNQNIYQLSNVTRLTQFPYIKWEDAISGNYQWAEERRKQILEEIEIALAAWDTFLLPVPGGWGLDYHTYIAKDEPNFARAIMAYNNQVETNLKNFEQLESTYNRPVRDMIKDGWISVEAGELLLKGADEFGDWDWHRIGPIDVGECLKRRKYLVEQAEKKGYIKELSKLQKKMLEGKGPINPEAELTKEQRGDST